jgi:hypothetical protein
MEELEKKIEQLTLRCEQLTDSGLMQQALLDRLAQEAGFITEAEAREGRELYAKALNNKLFGECLTNHEEWEHNFGC